MEGLHRERKGLPGPVEGSRADFASRNQGLYLRMAARSAGAALFLLGTVCVRQYRRLVVVGQRCHN